MSVEKFKANWKQSATIGAIAAVAVYLGVDTIIARGADAVGLFGALGPRMGSAAVVGGLVFLADSSYNSWA